MKTSDPDERLALLEGVSAWATLAILAGIVVEIWLLWFAPPIWSERIWSTTANALIGAGLIAEYVAIRLTIVASGQSKALADLKIAEAVERAAKADLARVRLEVKLSGRRLSADQSAKLSDALASVKDRVRVVQFMRLQEVEAYDFATDIIMSAERAGIAAQTIELKPLPMQVGIKVVDTEDGALRQALSVVEIGPIEYAPNSSNPPSILVGLKPPISSRA